MKQTLNYGFLLERASKKLKQTLQRKFVEIEAGITVDQWVILFELHKFKSLSQSRIGEYTLKDAPTVTRIIDLLAKKKLVKRLMSKKDRRKYIIELTPLGSKKVAFLLPTVIDFREKGWIGLNEKDINELKSILDKVVTNMMNY